jgi:hypothetical protein
VPQYDVFGGVVHNFLLRLTAPFKWAFGIEAFDVLAFEDFRHVRTLPTRGEAGISNLKSQVAQRLLQAAIRQVTAHGEEILIGLDSD